MLYGMDFFRLKFEFLNEEAGGKLAKKKQEDLVAAVNYTDAEAIATQMMVDNSMAKFDPDVKYEIVKTKVVDFLLTDVWNIDTDTHDGKVQYFLAGWGDEEALYAVSVLFTEEAEGDNKPKRTKEDIYVGASSPQEAIACVTQYLQSSGNTRDYVIRVVKFDKAASILVTTDMHKSYSNTKSISGL